MVASATPGSQAAQQAAQKKKPPPNPGGGSGGGTGGVVGGISNAISDIGSGNLAGAIGSVFDLFTGNVSNWLSSLGGFIGSGIEAGMVSLFKDTWGVIIGPLEILLGAVIGTIVLIIYFKDDIMASISFLGKALEVAL